MRGKNTIFYMALIICLIFIIIGAVVPNKMDSFFSGILNFVNINLSWYYVLVALLLLVFCLYIGFSKYGHVKMGNDDEAPEYSTFSWIAMLFTAGVAIGLLFYGVSEPVSHYLNPPIGEAGTEEAAKTGIILGIFHWGLHGWAIYLVTGLVLGYFSYRKNLPLRVSSAFYPLLGDKIYGPIGKSIDVLTILATIFGITTSLGMGALQLSSGLNSLWGVPNTVTIQVILVLVITFLFTLSAWKGLDKGIKRLSNLNAVLAIILVATIFIVGPTAHIFTTMVTSTGNYINNLVYFAFRLEPFRQDSWMGTWTIFYWGWYIAWGPFVGVFVARISRGRTLRQVVIGAIFAPTVAVIIWFSTFGGAALHVIHNLGQTTLAEAVNNDITNALFSFYEYLPFTSFLTLLSLILIFIFFITTADSSTFVTAIFSEGTPNPSNKSKIVWASMVAGTAIVLLISGGLTALQAASISIALPYSVIMLLMCYSTIKAMRLEFSSIEKVTNKNKSVEPLKEESSTG